MVEITIIAAFVAGILSFLSPCVLPLIPGFLAYLSGTTLGDTLSKKARIKLFLNSVFFVLGFSVIFSLLGVLLQTLLQNVAYTAQKYLSRVAGIIIILFGLYVLGLVKIPFLEREHKLKVKSSNKSYLTSFIFGSAFAVGWTPCVGFVLGAIFALAISQPATSFFYLFSYTVGLGIPFLLVGIFSGQALHIITKYKNFLKYFNIVMGIFLIILGILVFTQSLSQIASLGLVNSILLNE